MLLRLPLKKRSPIFWRGWNRLVGLPFSSSRLSLETAGILSNLPSFSCLGSGQRSKHPVSHQVVPWSILLWRQDRSTLHIS